MISAIKMQPRLTSATIVGIALLFLLPDSWRQATRLLVAWDSGTGLYIMLAAWMMAHSNEKKIRARAAQQDVGRIVVLALTIVTTLASIAAIVSELGVAKESHGEWQHIALAALTVLLSWTFMHTMFALHYAHEYYDERKGPKTKHCLEFPECTSPTYWDFVYHSFVIGTSAATADVNITSARMRKITTLHCVIAFFFNTVILALTMNIGANLF